MQGRFARLVVPVAGSEMDDRVLGMLPNLLRSEGSTITFLFVVEVPQAMPLDAELPTDIDRGERALRRAENTARQALPVPKHNHRDGVAPGPRRRTGNCRRGHRA